MSEGAAARDRGLVAVVGEALVDLVQAAPGAPFEAFVGGSPANVAVGLARLDVPTRLRARIADDLLGRQIRQHLLQNRVDLGFAVAAREPSTLALVSIGDDGAADYDFRVDGTADWQWRDDELAGLVDEEVVAVHSGSLALTMAPGAGVVVQALAAARAQATISYDPNCRPHLMGPRHELRPRVEQIVELADVVKASVEDLEWLWPGTAPEEAALDWLGRGPALVAVTLGAAGALAVSAEAGVVRVDGRRVEVVDTIGAGDSFTSALLAGLHRRSLLGVERRDDLRSLDRAALEAVLGEAVLASALTCTRRGAEPPTAAELRAYARVTVS